MEKEEIEKIKNIALSEIKGLQDGSENESTYETIELNNYREKVISQKYYNEAIRNFLAKILKEFET